MTKPYRHPLPHLLSLACITLTTHGHTQVDVNPPRPNVLLLVDSSGSMEYKTSTAAYPTCVPSGSGSEKSRWIDLVEVLSGAVPDYRCKRVDRFGYAFRQEYQIPNARIVPGTLNPPDYLYPIPYHRLMSGTCAPTPTTDPSAIGYCGINASKPCSFSASDKCDFPKSEAGLLDAFKNEIRFGLMTFDSDPDPSLDNVGTWSYVYGTSAQGGPKGCSSFSPQEVGARNAQAPLWEGRMVTFGPAVSNNEVDMLRERNQRIQDVLISTRPYGATPIAGMLHDARNFFWYDKDPDGTDPSGSQRIGPVNDPYTQGKCRENFILLLTDGEPNMDLRPYCEGCETCCPFEKPEDIAWSLAHETSKPPVKTFVVGFAVTEIQDDVGNTIDCDALAKEDPTATGGKCANPTSKGLKICCTLNRIAYNGGTEKAYFAGSVEKLRAALSEILSKASKGTTSRTVPVFASTTSSAVGTTSYRFYTSFTPKIDGSGLWQGVIDRQRFECTDGGSSPVARPISPESGDDFVNNVNSSSNASRRFYSVVAKRSGSTDIFSTRTVRAKPSLDDGVGADTGSDVSGDVTGFAATIPAKAMQLSTDEQRSRYLDWLIGKGGGEYNRCSTKTGLCNLIADVFHSTPAVAGSPTESLRDEGYLRFARGPARKRPLTLYASTNDGMLHAFKVASNDLEKDSSSESRVLTKSNNELWAFIPPAILPRIPSEYPNVHQRLLDGAPVVRDVAGKKLKADDSLEYPILERDLATIATELSDWRTILVQSFGNAYSGYFAIDVTDPVAGPKFLWQLTTDADGNELFGKGGTPTITTLYFDPSGGSSPREIAVALLPGGDGDTPPSASAAPCPRNTKQLAPPYFTSGTEPRSEVPCYTDASARRARSLTVVRLDTGEIIRSFRLSNDDAPASIAQRVNRSGSTESSPALDSPITGQPVAYPGWTGAIADRAYVGDRDGSLWRVDLSATSPAKWSMKLFFDAYHGIADARAGQPIEASPIVSTNEAGDVVVLFSTGSQEDLVGTGQTTNFVYSLREVVPADTSKPIVAEVNWYLKFDSGMRVAGPMTLFASNIYFSTYTPPASSYGCDNGTSSVWGMHFATRAEAKDLGEETNVPTAVATVSSDSMSLGGKPALPKAGDAASTKRVRVLTADGNLIASGSTIFGVGIGQLQGCYKTTAVTDPYFGTSYNRVDSGTSGTYQLVVQTGKAGASSGQGSTNYTSIDLPQPNNSPRISSWAMVME